MSTNDGVCSVCESCCAAGVGTGDYEDSDKSGWTTSASDGVNEAGNYGSSTTCCDKESTVTEPPGSGRCDSVMKSVNDKEDYSA